MENKYYILIDEKFKGDKYKSYDEKFLFKIF